MFGVSTTSIYGRDPSPAYTAQAGANLLMVSYNSVIWRSNLKNPSRWSQIGRSTVYPAIDVNVNQGDGNPYTSVYGNNKFIVPSSIQLTSTGRPFGYYLQAGSGYTPIFVDSSITGPFYGLNIGSSAFGNGVFVMTGQQPGGSFGSFVRVFHSTNGTSWTALNVANSGSSNVGQRVTFNNGKFFLSYSVGSSPPYATVMYKSTNGTTWTSFAAPTAISAYWDTIALNNMLFTSSTTEQYYTSINEGASWSPVTPTGGGPNSKLPMLFVNGVYIKYLQVVDPAAYYTSINGYTWTVRLNPLNLTAFTVNAGKFIASDRSGVNIYESTDGVNWTLLEQAIECRFGSGALLYGTL